MTTLVTGAGGFLGGHVIRVLAEAGEPVRALDLTFPLALPNGVEKVEASVLDPDALAQAAKGARTIIHAAANASLWARGRFAHDRINVAGTCRVMAVARKTGARVIHVSSFTTLVAHDAPDGAVLNESAEIPPSRLLGPYPKSKRQAELVVLSGVAADTDALIVMPAAPIGGFDVNLTPPAEMLRDLATGKTPALVECMLNLVDARAVASSIVAARDMGRTGERYLLAGTDIRMHDLADLVTGITGEPAPRFTVPISVALAAARVEGVIADLTGNPPKAPLTGVRLAARRCLFDNAKAISELGFAPRPIETCVEEAIAWMRDAGHV